MISGHIVTIVEEIVSTEGYGRAITAARHGDEAD